MEHEATTNAAAMCCVVARYCCWELGCFWSFENHATPELLAVGIECGNYRELEMTNPLMMMMTSMWG